MGEDEVRPVTMTALSIDTSPTPPAGRRRGTGAGRVAVGVAPDHGRRGDRGRRCRGAAVLRVNLKAKWKRKLFVEPILEALPAAGRPQETSARTRAPLGTEALAPSPSVGARQGRERVRSRKQPGRRRGSSARVPAGKVGSGYQSISQRRRTSCRPASAVRRTVACGASWRSGAAESRSRGWAFRATGLPCVCRRVGIVGVSSSWGQQAGRIGTCPALQCSKPAPGRSSPGSAPLPAGASLARSSPLSSSLAPRAGVLRNGVARPCGKQGGDLRKRFDAHCELGCSASGMAHLEGLLEGLREAIPRKAWRLTAASLGEDDLGPDEPEVADASGCRHGYGWRSGDCRAPARLAPTRLVMVVALPRTSRSAAAPPGRRSASRSGARTAPQAAQADAGASGPPDAAGPSRVRIAGTRRVASPGPPRTRSRTRCRPQPAFRTRSAVGTPAPSPDHLPLLVNVEPNLPPTRSVSPRRRRVRLRTRPSPSPSTPSAATCGGRVPHGPHRRDRLEPGAQTGSRARRRSSRPVQKHPGRSAARRRRRRTIRPCRNGGRRPAPSAGARTAPADAAAVDRRPRFIMDGTGRSPARPAWP